MVFQMKVLHVIASVSEVRGGPSIAMRCLARGLVRQGIEVDIATTDDNGAHRMEVPLGKPVRCDGATYWFFPVSAALYTLSFRLSSWLARNAPKYDVVHVHGLFGYPQNAASFLSAANGIPYVLRPVGTLGCWGMRNRRPHLKRLSLFCIEGPLLRRAAAVQYTTEQEKEEASHLGFNRRAIVIPDPVDDIAEIDSASADAFLKFFHIAPARPIIVFVGRLHPVKGLESLIDAFSLARAFCPDAVLVLAGDGEDDYVASLRQRASVLGLTGNIVWTGLLCHNLVPTALAAATICVLPSHSENFGIAAVEAMQAAKPVVVTTGVALHREITRAGAGVVVPPGATSLAQALVTLMTNPKMRASLGNRARQFASTTFSTAAVTRQLITLYERMLRYPRESAEA
jgi:glycosyltransferase involved in cell wall biosynthesis